MNKALALYATILKACLAKTDGADPEVFNERRFNVRALFIAGIFFKQQLNEANQQTRFTSVSEWLKTTFAESNFFSTIIAATDYEIIQIFEDHFKDWNENIDIDISSLYETLLGIETGEEHQQNKFSAVKHYRNKLGSYYTPKALARIVTYRTITSYLNANNPSETQISQLKFADFSCGAGNFLIEIIRFFHFWGIENGLEIDQKSSLLQRIARNIYAIDVDCIALEVAKLNLLLETGQPKAYMDISDHFYHANFLLQSASPVVEKTKQELFARGHIYHQGLALDKSKLREYDIILGNPPWEKIRFEEKKFAVNSLPSNFKDQVEIAKKALKNDSFFSLSNGGELNTYALFTNAAVQLKKANGVVGLIIKSGLVTSQVNKKLFNYLVKNQHIIAVYDFINRRKIFNIDSRERFCFLLLGRPEKEYFQVAMNLSSPEDINAETQMIKLNYEDLKRLNPLSGMLPNFSNEKEADLLLRLANKFPAFNTVEYAKFGRIVHLNSHAKDIFKRPSDNSLPIYEGKFFYQFNGKFAGFNGMSENEMYGSKASARPLNNKIIPQSRFFIGRDKWKELSKNHHEPFMLAWRSLTSATNTRTCIATILPFIPAIQSVQFLTTNPENILYLCGLFNSIVFDYILKKKLSGIDLTQSVVNQMPVPHPEEVSKVKADINQIIYSLLYNDERLHPLFEQLNLTKPTKSERIDLLRSLDLRFMILYNLSKAEIKLIVNEFPKQYNEEDKIWFLTQYAERLSDQSVSSSVAMPTLCPN
ncbi:Eco57I restriction-modification methylase domain-containing protein [Mucilaginibacter terrae]|uniref:Eco57I restriction-modification methylase domain-containing protein n=1 Tax=Mucilaginibacter terrae TaxID=1955052 RepID=UPI00363F57E1